MRGLPSSSGKVRHAPVAALTDPGCAGRDAAVAAQAATLAAVRTARGLLSGSPPLAVVMIVGQLRATAIDLLRGLGTDDVDSLNRVDDAIGLPAV